MPSKFCFLTTEIEILVEMGFNLVALGEIQIEISEVKMLNIKTTRSFDIDREFWVCLD